MIFIAGVVYHVLSTLPHPYVDVDMLLNVVCGKCFSILVL